jgi:hypothetical protein
MLREPSKSPGFSQGNFNITDIIGRFGDCEFRGTERLMETFGQRQRRGRETRAERESAYQRMA